MKTTSRSKFSQTDIIPLNTPGRVLICLLLVLFFSGCATTIKAHVTSDPSGADVYSGESPENLRYSGITPKTEAFTGVSPSWKAWHYQIKKPGYEDSEIIFEPQGAVNADRYVHAMLRLSQEKHLEDQKGIFTKYPEKQETSPKLDSEHALPEEAYYGFTEESNHLALVIGNADYRTSPLKNPVNDAFDMAQTLRTLGFEVIHKEDADQRAIENAISEFGRQLRKQGGVGLFYFAGHGIQVNGRNYLIPIDAEIETESDVRFEAVDAGRVLGKMEDAGNDLNIVILDACRDNPFARSFRTSSKGLARMDAPKGSLIAYATAPGSVAADGEGRNGIYTKYLLKHMTTPGLKVEEVLKQVRVDVINETKEKQIPWESSSLTGEFYFALKRGIAVEKLPPVEALAPKSDKRLEKERERLERERQELARLKIEIERKKLEAERKRLQSEMNKLQEVIIFEDSFNDNTNNWGEINTRQTKIKISNGKYLFSHRANKDPTYATWKSIDFTGYEDFIIEANIKKIDGVNNYGYGILWGGSDMIKNHFRFEIAGIGQYIYGKVVNGVFSEIITWKESPHINKYKSANRLSIRKRGNYLEFYINGNLVDRANFERFMGKNTGFIIEKKQTIEIEDVVVKVFK